MTRFNSEKPTLKLPESHHFKQWNHRSIWHRQRVFM